MRLYWEVARTTVRRLTTYRGATVAGIDLLLARAAVFVTNGGYSGVTLALHHGVPLVQAGTTEEKAEIAARIAYTGVGLALGTTRPAADRVRDAVRRVLGEPSFGAATARVSTEMQAHDPARESADLLERLAATGRLVPADRGEPGGATGGEPGAEAVTSRDAGVSSGAC